LTFIKHNKLEGLKGKCEYESQGIITKLKSILNFKVYKR
jgi:hypothetical protein